VLANGDKGRVGTPSSVDDETDLSTPTFALVVNGHSLVHALTPELERLFLGVAEHCTGESVNLKKLTVFIFSNHIKVIEIWLKTFLPSSTYILN
jgi:hypothetical protein